MVKESDVMVAVKEGDNQKIRKILYKFHKSHKKPSGKKNTINNADADGFTALHHASLLGHVDMLMAIVEMGGDVNSKDLKGMTSLHMASWAGKDDSVKCLLESHALPNISSFSGDTPLHLSAQHGYSGCAKLLLEHHADGTFRNSSLETPLDLACQYGHTHVVKQLVANEMVKAVLLSPATNSKSPLLLAAKSGHDDIVQLLLQAGVNVDEERTEGTALHTAALYGKTEVARQLLAAGADVFKTNKNGLIPLDVVNKFTTSRAALEIKQMLREAAGERVSYAQAVSDYSNQYDSSCISFKCGSTIAVLEQNVDGRWRGYVVGTKERIGHFPAMTVQLITQIASPTTSRRSTRSSQTNSSNSVEGNAHLQNTPSSNQTPTSKHTPSKHPPPVGVVPLGSYDVITLAQPASTEKVSVKQTAGGSLPPRMSSFNLHLPNTEATAISPPASPKPYSPRTSPKRLAPSPPKRGQSVSAAYAKSRSAQQNDTRGRVYSESCSRANIAKDFETHYADIEIPEGTSPTEKSPLAHNNYATVTHVDNNHFQYSDKLSVSPPRPILIKSGSRESQQNSGSERHPQISPAHRLPNLVKFTDSRRKTATDNYEDMTGKFPTMQFPPPPTEPHPSLKYSKSAHTTTQNDTYEELFLENSAAKKKKYTRSTSVPEPQRSKTSSRQHNNYEEMLPTKLRDTHGYENHQIPQPPLSTHHSTGEDMHLGRRLYESSLKNDQLLLEWLTELKLPGYFEPFHSHGFDMISIRAVTPEDLNLLQITKTGHRKKLLSEIARLPNENDLPNTKPENIKSWLSALGLLQYEPNFVEGGFDDIDFIKDLDRNDLEMIDVKLKGHQKKLIMAVQNLHNLELTDILDQAVAASPVKKYHDFHLDRQTSLTSTPDTVDSGYLSTSTNGIYTNSNTNGVYQTNSTTNGISSRETLPPPSGQEHEHEDMAHVPPPVAPKKSAPPPVASKVNGKPGPPPPKPKPKAGSIKAVNGHHAVDGLPQHNNQGVDSLTQNMGSVSMRPAGEIQGDQSEKVVSSKSRDLFKQMERRASESRSNTSISPNSTLNRSGSISSAGEPDTSMHPHTSSMKSSVPPPPAPKQRKAPPPAPPKRTSSANNGPIESPVVVAIEETPSQPPISYTSPRMPSFTPAPPPKKAPSPTTNVTPTFTPPPPVVDTPSQVMETPPSPSLEEFLPQPPSSPQSLPLADEHTNLPLADEPANLPLADEPANLPLAEEPQNFPAAEETQNLPAAEAPQNLPVAEAPVNITVEPIDTSNFSNEKKLRDNSFAETDDILADIMAEIDDFSSQIDNMF